MVLPSQPGRSDPERVVFTPDGHYKGSPGVPVCVCYYALTG